ncbi:TonB-dependent receptor [Chitinophagaceae bacterium 26-R-25]|nr:TonB-dependent receptor [Chitinophagaceae bacterium 26-R-25]
MKQLIAGFTLLSCYGAFAQTDSIKQKSLDEVVVTANKFAQKQSATGKVLTVIGRQELEKNTGRSLTQVLNEQAGLLINGSQNSPGSNQTVYMQGANAANTLILVDGMPVNDPSGISGEFDLNHFSIDQIERVEILKGTQSVLYGSDAVAGVINIITKRQTGNNPFAINGTVAGGTYGTFKGNAGVSGKIKWFNYNAQYNHLQSDGFSSANDKTGNQKFDNDGINQNNVSLSLGADAGRFKIRWLGSFDQYHAAIDDGAFMDDKNSTITNKNLQFGLSTIYTFDKGSITVNVNENHIERKLDDPANNPVGTNDYDPSFGNYKGNNYFAEAFINLNLHEHIGLLAGVDGRRQDASSETTYSKLGGDSSKIDMYSGYAALLFKNLGGFNAEVGGRYTHHSIAGSNFSYSFNPSYWITKEWKAFANLSSGFRAPSIYNLVSEYGNKSLNPEKSVSLETGLQFVSKNNMINARALYFNRTIKDVIIFQSTFTPPYGRYMNGDEQKDQGAELELTVHPTSKLSITANYTYVDGKLTTHTSNGKDTSYFNLQRRPKNAINGNVGYQFTEALFVRAGVRWQDKRQDLYYNPNTYAAEIVNLASYYNLDAYAEYKIPFSGGKRFVKVFGDFRNITNQSYFDIYGYNTRKFNFMAGLMVSL